jgi:O-antigen ligase
MFWGLGEKSRLIGLVDEFWIAALLSGHNGYLDLLVTLGIPGLVMAIFFVLVSPLRAMGAWLAAQTKAFPSAMCHAFVLIWVFVLLHNLMESSLLERAKVLWVFMLLVIFSFLKNASQKSASAPQ